MGKGDKNKKGNMNTRKQGIRETSHSEGDVPPSRKQETSIHPSQFSIVYFGNYRKCGGK